MALISSTFQARRQRSGHLFLTETLCACPRLVHVDLANNEAIANETLEPFANLHTLKFLSVSMCAGFKGSLEPLRRLFQLRFLYLYGCVALEESVEPLSILQELTYVDLEACFGLTAGLELLAALPKLKRLSVCVTRGWMPRRSSQNGNGCSNCQKTR